MEQLAVYLASASANEHRTYLLRDDSDVLKFTERPWGEAIAPSWPTPELIAHDNALADADFSSFYTGSNVIAKQRACDVIEFPALELLPVRIAQETRFLLNPQITLRRFRPETADVVQVPSGAILLMNHADLYLEDVPREPRAFWFHDGNFPRFLLCNEPLRAVVHKAKLTGLSFKLLGYARNDD